MKNLDLQKEEIIKCLHCGNETLMRQIGEFCWDSSDNELFACPVCHKLTLREKTMKRNSYYEIEYDDKETILYPINSINSCAIPIEIKEAFESALKIKNIDKNVCLMALRRTLELILKDKGAKKWGLKDKIEEIAEKGLLPKTLKEASSLTKMLGDTAAHDKELEIDQHDVESMAEFVGFIIEYLYIIPDKINTYKERLSAKKEN